MGLKIFLRNLRYLGKYNLKKIYEGASDEKHFELLDFILQKEENDNYCLDTSISKPIILDPNSTANYLVENNVSWCRFGDGELAMINNNTSSLFQKVDERLVQELKEVLLSPKASQQLSIAIGINYYFYNQPIFIYTYQAWFYYKNAAFFRDILEPYLDFNTTYLDSSCTAVYHLYKDFDYAQFYKRMSCIWEGKDIVIICGSTVFNKIQHNIFDSANSVKYIYGPRVNAFEQIDDIQAKALQTSKDQIKFIILGLAGTVLAYRLAVAGHRALDIGHLAKDFDAFVCNYQLNKQIIKNFYEAD